MILKISDKIFVSGPNKKVRIGSRVPADNREWLKRHGIVTDQAISIQSSYRAQPFFKTRTQKAAAVLVSLLICLIPMVLFLQQHDLAEKVKLEQARSNDLNVSNRVLQERVAQLSVINQTQQSEMSRMASQLRGLTQSFNFQLGDFKKGEAMYETLHRAYDSEMGRVSDQYDREIEALQKKVSHQDQMISSLESSIQSMDGVVVHANPIADGKGVTQCTISAVNADFQFVVVDSGALKGATPGQMVEFYHHGLLVGYGEIEKVYRDFSGVKVFSSAVFSQLEKGDTALIKATSISF